MPDGWKLQVKVNFITELWEERVILRQLLTVGCNNINIAVEKSKSQEAVWLLLCLLHSNRPMFCGRRHIYGRFITTSMTRHSRVELEGQFVRFTCSKFNQKWRNDPSNLNIQMQTLIRSPHNITSDYRMPQSRHGVTMQKSFSYCARIITIFV